MTCFSAKRKSTAYVDGRLRASEHARIASHLKSCDSCASYFEQVNSLRSSLRALPQAAAPAALSTSLRVLASREKRNLIETHGSRLRAVWMHWKFRIDEFMRPLTIPATGGILSSMLLFGTLALSIGSTAPSVNYEVPVGYYDIHETGANLVPVELRSSVILTISLDQNGRILDYAVHDGSASFAGNPNLLQYNNISLPKFPSVLEMARPISSDISISFTPIVFRQ